MYQNWLELDTRTHKPLLAWRTLRTYLLTLEPPQYIKRAPTMCHFEVQNIPTLVCGPNFGAFHHTTYFQSPNSMDFQAELYQNWLELDTPARTPLLAWRTLRAYCLTLGAPRYIKMSPNICNFEVKNIPTLVRGPNSGAFHHTTCFRSPKTLDV